MKTLFAILLIFVAGLLGCSPTSKADRKIDADYFGSWLITYTPKTLDASSADSEEIWHSKEKYDVILFQQGKALSAGLLKPHGHPGDYQLILKPTKYSEAAEIAANDPSVKAGYSTPTIELYESLFPIAFPQSGNQTAK